MSDHASGLNGAVAAELRAELARQGLRQQDLARLSGIPPVSIQRYLAPSRAIGIDVLDKMARALGLDAVRIMSAAGSRIKGPED